MSSEEIKLRPEVLWFAEQMEIVLRQNDHKGGWGDLSNEHLYWRLYSEVLELEHEIHGGWKLETIHEAVDVANFSMMIADKANKTLQERGSQE